MSNILTDFRVAMEALLAATFPSATVESEIFPGELEGISRDKDVIRVFSGPLVPESSNVNDARPSLMIRYFKKDPKLSALTSEVPREPAVMEQLQIDLAAMFEANLTSLGGMDYYHVEYITPDRELYAVESKLTAWTRNPMETGG